MEQRLGPHKKKRFEYQKYSEMTLKIKMFVVLEIINIFSPLKIEEINYITKHIFKSYKTEEIEEIIAFLVGGEFVTRCECCGEYFRICRTQQSFIEFKSLNINQLKVEVADFHLESGRDIIFPTGARAA
ncbi:MAG: hypothetical protein AAGA21_06915 [Pseudomonadota bacterium]